MHEHPTAATATTATTAATDETVPDVLGTDTHATAVPEGRTRRTRRLVVAAVALALVAGATGAVAFGDGSSPSTSRAGATPAGTVVPAVDVGTESAGPEGQAQPQPVPDPEPPAEPGVLTLDVGAVHLAPGHYSGSFTVGNDGGSPLDWTWQPGSPAISVSESGGTLAPGESTVVGFQLNPFNMSEGGFAFINHVTSGATTLKLTISGVRTPIVVNPNIPPGPQDITS